MDTRLNTWVVAGAGPSLTEAQLAHVQGRAPLVVVNNVYSLAPWASVLVACDSAWWVQYGEDTKAFGGLKLCPNHARTKGVTYYREPDHPLGCNSGLYGMLVAHHLGAKRILLLGIDMQGSHYFGHHPDNLRNPNEWRHSVHRRQFEKFKRCEVVNCSPDSALECFKKSSIFKEL